MKKRVYFILTFIVIISILGSDFSNKKEKIITRNYLKEADLRIDSKNYFIDNQMIQPVNFKTTKKDFKDSFQATQGNLNLICDNNTDYVGTNCLLQTIQESVITSEYGIVVYGDVTGDGLGTITDIVKMMTYVEKKEGLDTLAKKESADINDDNSISFTDVEIFGLSFQENKSITFPSSDQVETKIEISTYDITLEKNSSKQLIATTNKGNTSIIKWESKNSKIAVVDNTGLVTGISNGQTTITVSAADGTQKEVSIEVITATTGITLDKNNISMDPGEKITLTETISPNDASNKAVTWTSSNPNVATVDNTGVITALTAGETVITVTTKDGSMTASCHVTVVAYVTSISLSEATVKIGKQKQLIATITPSNAINKQLVWSSSNEKIATVDQNGIVTGIAAGSTTITASTGDAKISKTAKVNVAMTANVDFRNIDNCENNDIISTTTDNTGKTVTLHRCIDDYVFHKKYLFIQNLAITKDYIYFIQPYNGAWTYPSNIESKGEEAEFKRISVNHIIRISRIDNTYQMMTINYAGHGQSFDVADKTITASTNDVIYTNAFAYLYDTTLNGIYRYGARYRGVSYTSFKENYNANGSTRVPGISLAISSDGTKLHMLKSSDYQLNGSFDSELYYNDVIAVGKNSAYMVNPEVAVDEKNGKIALVDSNNIYIYDLATFKTGVVNLLNVFPKTGGKQGIELDGNYLYQWADGTTGHKVLKKYNITTGKLVTTIDFDVSDFYEKKERIGYEAEGISIYNGRIYVGISGWNCTNTSCSSKRGYNDILLVKGA